MIEEKEKVRSPKRLIWIFIGIYFLIVAGYYLGKAVGVKLGLEYRFWVDAGFRIWVWFVPVLFAGVLLLKACTRQWKRKSPWKWILSVLVVGYAGVAVYASFLYVLVSAFTMTSDERMPDGNLVVAVPSGMESIHHYAEPVGLLYRRDFTFDEERTADSLTKMYGVPFRALREENGQWVYGSDAYPEIEVTNICYGFMEVNYLDNNFTLALTSKMLKEHQEVFDSYGVELVTYQYGRSVVNPDGQGTCNAVLVSEDNKEYAAEAIAEFIKATLQEDLRSDGKSIWDRVNGSIFLVTDTETECEYQSIRNIPFARKPEYTWIFDASVTADEVVEKIVIKNEAEAESKDGLPELDEEDTAISDAAENDTGTEEISQEMIDRYLSIEPSCSCVTGEGMEYRMIPVDRALGSNFYVLMGTKDGGKTCDFMNLDPYNGSGGESRWIIFLDENLGFSCLAHAAGAYGSLYRTEDGGSSWEEITYPSAKVKLSDGTFYNPFVMPEIVYEEDGIIYMEVGQGADGDYYDDELGFCHGLYQSSDLGRNWEFVKNIPKER